jgi:hypothetical protein
MLTPGEQERKLKELRKRLHERGLFFEEFDDKQDFAEKFTHDLYSLAIKLRLSPFKADACPDSGIYHPEKLLTKRISLYFIGQ